MLYLCKKNEMSVTKNKRTKNYNGEGETLQPALKNIVHASDNLEEDIAKFKFVGDEFGYTGTTCVTV